LTFRNFGDAGVPGPEEVISIFVLELKPDSVCEASSLQRNLGQLVLLALRVVGIIGDSVSINI